MQRRRSREKELDNELRFHIEEHTNDLIRNGVEPEEARRQALLEFGGIELAKEECRDAQPFRWLDDLIQDIRFAVRGFARKPTLAIVAILTLALGIGANTAMFSISREVLLKTLPIPHPEEIVEVVDLNPQVSGNAFGWPASYPTFQLYRENNRVFSGIFAYFSTPGNAVFEGVAEPVTALFASAEIHQVLGIPPVLGRLLPELCTALAA